MKIVMKSVSVFLLFSLTVQLFAAVAAYPRRGQEWYQTNTYVPSVAADIIASDVFVDRIHLANTSASAVTVILKDKSTDCNSAACQWWPTVSIAANQVYTADVGGIISKGGVNWVASTNNVVDGYLKGAYLLP